jgi:DNA-binding response OmpR family regulator
MPKWDGRITLSYFKSSKKLSTIPVIILSDSDIVSDKEDCTKPGALTYIQEPYHFQGYKDIVKKIISLLNITS